jgi:hypothetical protein
MRLINGAMSQQVSDENQNQMTHAIVKMQHHYTNLKQINKGNVMINNYRFVHI